jgi:20S proteasome alpha/beta subunit
MSLAVAIEATNGIVLAADSRVTFGDPRGMTAVNDTVQKIYRPNSCTAVAVVGMPETGAALIQHIIIGLATQPNANIDVVAETFRAIGNQHFVQWFGQPQFLMGPLRPVPTPRPDLCFVLIGYDAGGNPKIFRLHSIPPFNFAPNLSTTGFATAGVDPLAVYFLNRFYRRNLDLEIAKDLAVYCIVERASQDGKVGGPVRLAVVKLREDTIFLEEEETSIIVRRAEQHRETLRNSFLNPEEDKTKRRR